MNLISLAPPEDGCKSSGWNFLLQSCSTLCAEGCNLIERWYLKAPVTQTNRYWHLCKYWCYRKSLHVSARASWFYYVRDLQPLVQRVFDWVCESVRHTNKNEGSNRVRTADVQAAAKVSVYGFEGTDNSWKRTITWSPHSVAEMIRFRPVLRSITDCFIDHSSYEAGKALSSPQWSETLQTCFFTTKRGT